MSTASNLAGVVDSLAQRHPSFDRSKIERLVAEAYDSYRSAPIQAYVVILTHREVDAYLGDLERGGSVSTRPAAGAETVFSEQRVRGVEPVPPPPEPLMIGAGGDVFEG